MTSLDTRTTENHTFWAKTLNMDFKMITSRRNYQGLASLTSLRASWIWAGARATRAPYFDRILRGDANRMSECYRQYLTWSRVTQNRLINLFNINIHLPEKYLAKLENSILLLNNVYCGIRLMIIIRKCIRFNCWRGKNFLKIMLKIYFRPFWVILGENGGGQHCSLVILQGGL